MSGSITQLEARRRRRARQLLLLRVSPFGAAEEVLRASSSLDEAELRASWQLGRERLAAAAEFETAHGSSDEPLRRPQRH
jgi:hypothetical protein